MEKQESTRGESRRWFDLMELGRLCPQSVSHIKFPDDPEKTILITKSTRMILWAIIGHCSDSDESFVLRGTLMDETKMTRNTLDDAIASLKSGGLLKTREEFIVSTGKFRHYWIIQRKRLRELVGDRLDDSAMLKIVEAAKRDGESSVEVSVARSGQVTSKLKSLADGTWINVTKSAAWKKGVLEMLRLTIRVPLIAPEPESEMERMIPESSSIAETETENPAPVIAAPEAAPAVLGPPQRYPLTGKISDELLQEVIKKTNTQPMSNVELPSSFSLDQTKELRSRILGLGGPDMRAAEAAHWDGGKQYLNIYRIKQEVTRAT